MIETKVARTLSVAEAYAWSWGHVGHAGRSMHVARADDGAIVRTFECTACKASVQSREA